MRVFIAGTAGIVAVPHRNAARPVLVVGDAIATRPVDPLVQRAIEAATTAAFNALVGALHPFGLHPGDIAMPQFEQVIYRDETPIFHALLCARGAGTGQP